MNQEKVMYSGVIHLGDTSIECYVLENDERVLSGREMQRALRMVDSEDVQLTSGSRLTRHLGQKSIQPYIAEALNEGKFDPIICTDGKKQISGYRAEALIELCDAFLQARSKIELSPRQKIIAEQCEILVRGFAKVGLIALIDEATGYQKSRKHDALRELLNQYLAEGMQKWIHTFPDSFFSELDRLYNNEPTTSRTRPQYYGHFINKYIYEPIEYGYLKRELDKLNITDKGTRRARFHQWLSENGREILKRQISKVEGQMELFSDINHFRQGMEKQKIISIAPYLFEDMNDPRG